MAGSIRGFVLIQMSSLLSIMSASTDSGDPPDSQSADRSTDVGRRRAIGHDDFDPLGTLVLIGLYFLVLLIMWGFTYFVEFLGSDPTPMMLVVG